MLLCPQMQSQGPLRCLMATNATMDLVHDSFLIIEIPKVFEIILTSSTITKLDDFLFGWK